ncbi:MAG: hypothetical protein JNK11_12790, partial [Alphaproteobacteria bacterium]|nr:hypothetical protein [Alphaproteobacteria bacterium]
MNVRTLASAAAGIVLASTAGGCIEVSEHRGRSHGAPVSYYRSAPTVQCFNGQVVSDARYCPAPPPSAAVASAAASSSVNVTNNVRVLVPPQPVAQPAAGPGAMPHRPVPPHDLRRGDGRRDERGDDRAQWRRHGDGDRRGMAPATAPSASAIPGAAPVAAPAASVAPPAAPPRHASFGAMPGRPPEMRAAPRPSS